MIWRLILVEYGPDVEYVKVENIIVTDRLPTIPLNKKEETT